MTIRTVGTALAAATVAAATLSVAILVSRPNPTAVEYAEGTGVHVPNATAIEYGLAHTDGIQGTGAIAARSPGGIEFITPDSITGGGGPH